MINNKHIGVNITHLLFIINNMNRYTGVDNQFEWKELYNTRDNLIFIMSILFALLVIIGIMFVLNPNYGWMLYNRLAR